MLNDRKQEIQPRGPVIGIMIAAYFAVILPLFLPYFPTLGDWYYPRFFLLCGLMSLLPFLLARIAPNAAGFDTQWLPSRWTHWIWFIGLVVLLFVGVAISILMIDFLPLKYTPPVLAPGFTPDISYIAVFIHGITMILLFPVAEEIFFRGYLLEQLRKVTHSGIALLIQSLLFSLIHLPRTQFYPHSTGYLVIIATFFYGLALGAWRIKFRSMVPLMLAHIILNGVLGFSGLKTRYDYAQFSSEMPSDFFSRTRTSPQCWEIYRLTKEPTSKAIPAIIEFANDQDDVVSIYATTMIQNHYRNDAEPYLREALASDNNRTVESVLFSIGMGYWPHLAEDVRKVAWNHNDPNIQRRAALALYDYNDAEGLRKIAAEHPNEKTRDAAQEYLRMLGEND